MPLEPFGTMQTPSEAVPRPRHLLCALRSHCISGSHAPSHPVESSGRRTDRDSMVLTELPDVFRGRQDRVRTVRPLHVLSPSEILMSRQPLITPRRIMRGASCCTRSLVGGR